MTREIPFPIRGVPGCAPPSRSSSGARAASRRGHERQPRDAGGQPAGVGRRFGRAAGARSRARVPAMPRVQARRHARGHGLRTLLDDSWRRPPHQMSWSSMPPLRPHRRRRRARQAHLRPRHGIPRRGQTSRARVFRTNRAVAAGQPAHVSQDRRAPALVRRLVRVAGIRGDDRLAGRAAVGVAGARDGGHRLRHPARRQPRRLLEPRRRQPRDGDDARHAGRELVPLARPAQPLSSHLHEHRGRGRRHQLRPFRAAVAGAAALPACTTSSTSTCGRCTGSCSRSGTSSTTSRT